MGWTVRLGPKLGEIRHGMTNRRISCQVYEARLASDDPSATCREPDPGTPESGWFTVEEAIALPLAASARKTLTSLLHADLTAPEIPH